MLFTIGLWHREHVSNWWPVARHVFLSLNFTLECKSSNFKSQPAYFFVTLVVYNCLQR